jgi:aldose 1-epimerase
MNTSATNEPTTAGIPAGSTTGTAPAPATPAPATPAPAAPKQVTKETWGKLADGRTASIFTLDNGRGLRVRISDFGGAIISIETPDRAGKIADVALGYKTLDNYANDTGTYLGSVVGRVANRIANGQFTLDGVTYKLALNNAPADIPCSLHGGKIGFDKVLWDTAIVNGVNPAIVLKYRAKDGEEGFPGNLDVTITYTLLPDNTLRVRYDAVTDKATPVNISQHSYFNLAGEGEGTVLEHRLTVAGSKITPVTAGLIPTGELLPVKDTPFDFTTPRAIGERIADKHQQIVFGFGYDHNWVLDAATDGVAGDAPRFAAELYDEKSGRALTVLTTEPGIQIYSANWFDGTIRGKSDRPYVRHGGVALETQHFPDSPNQKNFPNVILRPGKSFISITDYKFSVKKLDTAQK